MMLREDKTARWEPRYDFANAVPTREDSTALAREHRELAESLRREAETALGWNKPTLLGRALQAENEATRLEAEAAAAPPNRDEEPREEEETPPLDWTL